MSRPEPTLGENLRRIRCSQNISQSLLAARAGLSRVGYSRIEQGLGKARTSTLTKIAKQLNVRVEELFVPITPLPQVRLRTSKPLNTRTEILAKLSLWLEAYKYLESVLDDRIVCAFERGRRTQYDAIYMAMQARAVLCVRSPLEPITDICALLENNGIKILEHAVASEYFRGCSSLPDPVIAVNSWNRVSVEHMVFRAVQELGHLVLHRDSYDTLSTKEHGKELAEAELFASHFLMPQEAFEKTWDRTCGLTFESRLQKTKRLFSVGHRTVLHRLNSKRYKSPVPAFKIAEEPNPISRYAFFPTRLARLVRRAVETGNITLSRAAEILGHNTRTMREIASSWV